MHHCPSYVISSCSYIVSFVLPRGNDCRRALWAKKGAKLSRTIIEGPHLLVPLDVYSSSIMLTILISIDHEWLHLQYPLLSWAYVEVESNMETWCGCRYSPFILSCDVWKREVGCRSPIIFFRRIFKCPPIPVLLQCLGRSLHHSTFKGTVQYILYFIGRYRTYYKA